MSSQGLYAKVPWEPLPIMFVGDLHLDGYDFDRELFEADMARARERGAKLVLMGDLWSNLMVGDLKRYTVGRDKIGKDASINVRLRLAYELLLPYVDMIEVSLLGNHETEVIKRHGQDMLALLLDRLNEKKTEGLFPDKRIQHGGYRSFLRLQFNDGNGHTAACSVFLHHGAGGGAPVTKAMMDRRAIRMGVDADTYVIGHKQKTVATPGTKEYQDTQGNVRKKKDWFIAVGGYEGGLEQPDYTDGYQLDWGSEKFYAMGDQGSALVTYEPRRPRSDGWERKEVHQVVELE